jgi:hypothetical protein
MNARNLLKMLGICFFTQRRKYTGEPVWEGEKGRFLVKTETLKI